MGRTTQTSYLRTRGGSESGSIGVLPVVLKGTFDPTAASAETVLDGSGKALVIPAGSIPLSVSCLGGGTGGVSPTVDVGDGSTDDLFANELAVDAPAMRQDTASGIGVLLTANTTIYGKVGASAATGGTATILVEYVPSDDGVAHT